MVPIRTLYIVNHSHTDIGFTDYQDLCFRQHAEFIEQALDLCEATADYPEEARYRWVCEVTGTTERYLRQASPGQRDRFRSWHELGAIDVAAMQYNLTPMLNVEQMHRSLYPVRRLRDEFGLTIESAMQCDVNGVSWLYADLLPAIDIDFLTMAVNPIRGGVPKPLPSAFWWEGPAGGKILVWNGFHYLWGRSIAKLGDWRFVEESLPPILASLEADPAYPFDFLYCQSTHPIRVDNGPPDIRMADFVRDWNAANRTPRLAFITPTAFARILRQQHGNDLPTRRGDWLDWWSDGVASSAYETGVSRASHERLLMAETIAAREVAIERPAPWTADRANQAYEQATLYDEHTWGAFASIAAPNALWTKGQWNRKANFAYTASAEANDLLARAARATANDLATAGPEGRFNLGDLTPEAAYPASNASDLLVLNTLPWARQVIVEEPEIRGGAAPAGVLESLFPRDVPWGGERPPIPHHRITGEVPGLGFAFLPLANGVAGNDLAIGERTIENAHYRIRLNPTTGAVAEWLDKDLHYDFASSYRGWGIGQYIYETVDSPAGRDALLVGDFSLEDFGYWRTDTPFRRVSASRVTIHEPEITQGQASIVVEIHGAGIRTGRCTYTLQCATRSLAIDWLLDKEHVTDVEAVFIAFPFALGTPSFRADLNGIACTPDQDQLAGSVRNWYPIQRWVDVSDGVHGVTLTPLDAPLVQLGGITSDRGREPQPSPPEGPTIMSWALQNHWTVNFKASQGGETPLRYRLTTHAGPTNDAAAARFGAESVTPPIVLRDYTPKGDRTGQFIDVGDQSDVLVTAKLADNGDGIIVRLQNILARPQRITLRFPAGIPTSASLTSPIEVDGDSLSVDGQAINISLASRAIQSVRVRYQQ